MTLQIAMAILPLYQNRRGNFHGHFAFVSKPTWKFPWPFWICIKTDVEISMAILPLYQNRRGNFHGHFAFVSKPTWKLPWPFCLCIKNWHGNFHGYFPFVSQTDVGNFHGHFSFYFCWWRAAYSKKDIFRNILQNKEKVWQKIPSISEKLLADVRIR